MGLPKLFCKTSLTPFSEREGAAFARGPGRQPSPPDRTSTVENGITNIVLQITLPSFSVREGAAFARGQAAPALNPVGSSTTAEKLLTTPEKNLHNLSTCPNLSNLSQTCPTPSLPAGQVQVFIILPSWRTSKYSPSQTNHASNADNFPNNPNSFS